MKNLFQELFFYYPWNNFLHSTVSSMIEGILTSGNEELEALVNPLLFYFFFFFDE